MAGSYPQLRGVRRLGDYSTLNLTRSRDSRLRNSLQWAHGLERAWATRAPTASDPH